MLPAVATCAARAAPFLDRLDGRFQCCVLRPAAAFPVLIVVVRLYCGAAMAVTCGSHVAG